MPKKPIKINKGSQKNVKVCSHCNPQKYLKVNFSFVTHESKDAKEIDVIQAWERIRFICGEPYDQLIVKYSGDKKRFFEPIPVNQIRKEIPSKFREIFPTETNEKFQVLRVYPAGVPNGSANPRIIGFIKHTIFYIFYLDWDGKLYEH